MPVRRVSSFARLSPLQPGRRARRRRLPAVVPVGIVLAGLAGALVAQAVGSIAGAFAAVGLLAVALILAVRWPLR
jgi:hypothetical protein